MSPLVDNQFPSPLPFTPSSLLHCPNQNSLSNPPNNCHQCLTNFTGSIQLTRSPLSTHNIAPSTIDTTPRYLVAFLSIVCTFIGTVHYLCPSTKLFCHHNGRISMACFTPLPPPPPISDTASSLLHPLASPLNSTLLAHGDMANYSPSNLLAPILHLHCSLPSVLSLLLSLLHNINLLLFQNPITWHHCWQRALLPLVEKSCRILCSLLWTTCCLKILSIQLGM